MGKHQCAFIEHTKTTLESFLCLISLRYCLSTESKNQYKFYSLVFLIKYEQVFLQDWLLVTSFIN